MSDTRDRIAPFLAATYGTGPMVDSLADYLSRVIDEGEFDRHRGREYTIMRACWDWFPGGSTAKTAAREIVAVL